jgi:protein-tyrosine-phosphatase
MQFDFSNIKQKDDQQRQERNVIILFVCVENAGRSQMAEAFFNYKYAPKGHPSISAGTRAISQINPVAVQAMNEVGIQMRWHQFQAY